MGKLKAAIQTMCLEKEINEKGWAHALKRTREIGYTSAEISGHLDLNRKNLEELTAAVKEFDIDICAVSCVYFGPFPQKSVFPERRSLSLADGYEETLETLRLLNAHTLRYMGLPVDCIHTEEDIRSYCEMTEEYAGKLKKDGIQLCAHNHVGEFRKIAGKTLWNWTLELCPSLEYEMDVFGVQMSGLTPQEYLRQASGRTPLIHFSDISVNDRIVRGFSAEMLSRVPMGKGNIPIKPFLAAAEAAGSEYCIMEANDLCEENVFTAMKNAKQVFDLASL